MSSKSGSRLVRGVLVGVVAGFGLGLSRHLLPVIYPHMQAPLGLGAGQMGGLATSYFLAYMFFAYFWGHLTDRIGSRNVIIFCLLITALAMALVGWSSRYYSLVLFSLVLGAGGGGLYVPIIAALVKIFSPGQKGKAIAVFFLGEGSIVLAVGLLIPWMALYFPWRLSWFFSALVCAALIVPILLLLSPKPDTEGNEISNVSLNLFSDLGRPTFLRDQRLLWLSAVYHLHGLARGAVVTFVVAYLVEFAVSHQDAGAAFSLMGLGFLPGSFLAGYLVDRFRTFVLLGLLVVELACIAAIGFVQDLLVINSAMFVLGGCLTGVPTVVGAINAEISPANKYGQTLGWLTFCLSTGIMLSPVFCGYMAEYLSTLSAPLFFALIALLASLPFAALLEITLLRDREFRSTQGRI